MTHTSADLLEFESLRELLVRYAGSAMGRAEVSKVRPAADRSWLAETHALNTEAIEYLRAAAKPQPAARGAAVRLRFLDLPDSREAAGKLRIEGAVLEGKEIFDLLSLLDRAADTRMLLMSVRERFPLLSAKAARMGEMRPLLRELSGRIQPDGSLADDASVALHRIRRGIEKQKRLIQDSLERFLRAHRSDGVLQEDFVTLRNDRFVVPIVTGQQGRVEGVIHGSSGSGHTLFVEPFETIELNNELVRMTEEEAREAHRILREMTQRLRRHSEEIAASIEGMGELDWLFGKATFAADFECSIPRFSPPDAPRLHLDAARHPLLEDVLRRQRKPVVPISLTLDPDCRTLLLSGPNTGGKTVALKTVGLLALMAQSGIPVPASEAEFPVFEQVLADLGDQQSIAESLSSFSAHIRRVKEILEIVTQDSLVLLDELGRATDPEEGGSLGVAIIEHLCSWKAFTLASTHLLALKVYGARREGVINGSMGFDRETLQPTYRLRLGAPGESAGLAIAQQLGMPGDLVEKARAAMSTRERDLSDFLAQLQERTAALAAAAERLEEQRQSLSERERAVAREWEQKESAKLKELERRVEVLMGNFEEQARQTMDTILAGAQQRKAAEQARRKVAGTMREMRHQFQATVLPAGDAARQGELAQPLRLAEGARVRLRNVREPARVRRRLSDDRLEVETGFLKMQVPIDDVLEVLPEGAAGSPLPANVSFQPAGPRWDVSHREINLIGKRAEEAVQEVDKFLDQAVMASVSRVRIVHGHGMGVLKRAVAMLLAQHPHVEKFYAAPQSEGGSGATIAELKE
ncbi:MAG: endonuclease MutS2 [Acidobacteria bacterium]|nr:endonuclease MutS2 [Acidobacteriota bacterium]